jgi:sulfopyruvate decarboxylase TPP-binding subunit
VKRQLAVVIAHRGGGKENIAPQIQNTGRQIPETLRNRAHVHINFFLIMTDTMASQNNGLSSWNTLYSIGTEKAWLNNPQEENPRIIHLGYFTTLTLYSVDWKYKDNE